MSRNLAMGILVLTVAVGAGTARAAFDFSNVQNWTGSGPNQAAMVVDWRDGLTPQSLAWGYRWSGTATNIDMFLAIVHADPRLFAKIGPQGADGVPLYGLGYDLNGNGIFGITGHPTFTNGVYQTTAAKSAGGTTSNVDGATATDAGDHYTEGWFFDGYWSTWTISGSVSDNGHWTSNVGLDGSNLTNDTWQGFAFDATYSGTIEPAAPVAAASPEPATLVLLALGLTLLWLRRARSARV